jgi:hypothetical protein
MQILNRLKVSPVNVPNAVKSKKYFQMNLTGRIPAAPVTSPSTFRNVNWKPKAKAFHPANRPCEIDRFRDGSSCSPVNIFSVRGNPLLNDSLVSL